MIKLFRKIHLWLSLPFGIVITLICFSGAMLVFETEITQAIQSPTYYVASSAQSPLSIDELIKKVEATLPDSAYVTGVTVFADPARTYQINVSRPAKGPLFIDQYNGEITGTYRRIGLFSTMFRLHRWLLDTSTPGNGAMRPGKLIVGISTIIFVLVLITGIVLWWPRAKSNFRKSLSISLLNGWKNFWKGLHVAGGMYALILVTVMALTGLTWSFGWYRTAFYSLFGGSQTVAHSASSTEKTVASVATSSTSPWQQIYAELHSLYPDASQITIGNDNASVTLGRYGNTRSADRFKIVESGDISLIKSYSHASGADILRGWIYSVHTGSFGGLFTRILWLLAALIGATLPLTGYYLWIKRLVRKKL